MLRLKNHAVLCHLNMKQRHTFWLIWNKGIACVLKVHNLTGENHWGLGLFSSAQESKPIATEPYACPLVYIWMQTRKLHHIQSYLNAEPTWGKKKTKDKKKPLILHFLSHDSTPTRQLGCINHERGYVPPKMSYVENDSKFPGFIPCLMC